MGAVPILFYFILFYSILLLLFSNYGLTLILLTSVVSTVGEPPDADIVIVPLLVAVIVTSKSALPSLIDTLDGSSDIYSAPP